MSIRALRAAKDRHSLSAKFVEVTAEMAEEWLGVNTHNRPIAKHHVTRISRELRNGHWMVNGETIKFDWHGVLLDGQHRLRAIIDSGVSAECLVVYGLNPECFPTIDGGSKRTSGHHVAVLGKANYNTLGPAVSLLRRYERGDLASTSALDKDVSGPEVIETLERYPTLEDSIPFGRAANKILSASQSTFFHFVFAQKDRVLADAFFEGLATGVGLDAEDAVYHLRERLLRAKADRATSLDKRYVMALTIKAWNKTRSGEPTRQLRWTPGEGFPEIQ